MDAARRRWETSTAELRGEVRVRTAEEALIDGAGVAIVDEVS